MVVYVVSLGLVVLSALAVAGAWALLIDRNAEETGLLPGESPSPAPSMRHSEGEVAAPAVGVAEPDRAAA